MRPSIMTGRPLFRYLLTFSARLPQQTILIKVDFLTTPPSLFFHISSITSVIVEIFLPSAVTLSSGSSFNFPATITLFKLTISFLLMSFMADETMTKENGAIVINTTEIGKNVEGYQGPTPLKVYIKNNMVEKIEFLKSPETPKYYDRVKKFLQSKWDGLKVKEAREKEVDVVTGATYSSEAVIENVRLALDYYQSHK